MIAIQSDVTFLPVGSSYGLREEEDALKSVWIIGVQVNPEKWISLEWLELVIKIDIVLSRHLPGVSSPGWISFIDAFAFELNVDRHEVAVLGDQGA